MRKQGKAKSGREIFKVATGSAYRSPHASQGTCAAEISQPHTDIAAQCYSV